MSDTPRSDEELNRLAETLYWNVERGELAAARVLLRSLESQDTVVAALRAELETWSHRALEAERKLEELTNPKLIGVKQEIYEE